MIRLKITMLIPKGQKLTPKISPCWVLLKLNCTPQSAIRNDLKTNPNAEATSTMKHPQKSFFLDASSTPADSVLMFCKLIVVIVFCRLFTYRFEYRHCIMYHHRCCLPRPNGGVAIPARSVRRALINRERI